MMRRLLLAGVTTGVVAVTVVALASSASSVTIPAFKAADQAALPGADWVVAGGNLGAQRHSALTQITPGNVGSLKLAFSFDLDGKGYEPRGLFNQESIQSVYKGVMYSMDSVGRVYASDATNGNKLWYFEPNNANSPFLKPMTYSPAGFPTIVRAATPRIVAAVRGLTIGDGMVFAPQMQGNIVALDAKTGTQIWTHKVLDPKFAGTLAEPPIYFDGKIISATAGGDGGFSCIVFALDAKTGKSLWHFNIIPQKGQPGYETWKTPLFWNAGGASWTTLAVDPALKLVHISTGNTVPYSGYQRGPGKEYYTAGNLVLHTDTGKLAWFFQNVHHDNWDADTTHGPMFFDGTVNGKPNQKGVISVNRTGLMFVLDRKTGKPIFPAPETPVPTYGPGDFYPTQPIPTTEPILPKVLNDPDFNAFTGLQGPDGKPFIYHNTVPTNAFPAATPQGYHVKVSSNISGTMPGSVDPKLGYAFYEGTNSVSATQELPPSEIAPLSPIIGIGAIGGSPHTKGVPAAQMLTIPQVAAINGSLIVAMDLNTGKRVWMNHHKTVDTPNLPAGTNGNFAGGIVSTDGGVLFTANGTSVSAFNSKTGAMLWTSPALRDMPWMPMTYAVNGKQYVAVEVRGLRASPTEPFGPDTIYVYALP